MVMCVCLGYREILSSCTVYPCTNLFPHRVFIWKVKNGIHYRFNFYLLLWVILNVFSYIWVICISFSPNCLFISFAHFFFRVVGHFFLQVLPFTVEIVNILSNSCSSFNTAYCDFCHVFLKKYIGEFVDHLWLMGFVSQKGFPYFEFIHSSVFFLCVVFVGKFHWGITHKSS